MNMTTSALSLPGARISDFLELWAERTPLAEALVAGDCRMSYHDLRISVDRLARAMLAAGVVKGDRIATLQTPHPDYVVALLAATSIGAIWVGLNPRYRLEELQHVVSDAEPKLLVTRTSVGGRNYADELKQLNSTVESLRQVIVFDGDPLLPGCTSMSRFLEGGQTVTPDDLRTRREACGGKDACLIVYTSGSTGKPKGALLHHEAVASFAIEQNRLWPVEPLRILNYFPINHIGCVVDLTIPCLAAGGCLVFLEQFTPAGSLNIMVREKITLWISVPTVFELQMALPDFESYDLSAVRLIVWEGATMPDALIERLLRVGPPLATAYGMTETLQITATPMTHESECLIGSAGVPFAGVDIRLVDAEGHCVETGEVGEVQVRSGFTLLGYWRQPDATAAAMTADGFFRTGDLAQQRADGSYRIVGRLKEMFKSGGYNVYPREIEAVLEAHPAVAIAAVVSVPDPVWQEVGVAFVVPGAQVTSEQIRVWCRERLANYKVPKRIVIDPAVPLLPIGKIDKKQLQERARMLRDEPAVGLGENPTEIPARPDAP